MELLNTETAVCDRPSVPSNPEIQASDSKTVASPAPRHIPWLDELRGIAVLFVYVFHSLVASYAIYSIPWKGWLPDLAAVPLSFSMFLPFFFGGAGVAIFFTLSGFCIHLSHARSSDSSLRSYAWRRFTMIYPPYLMAMLLFLFIPPFGSLDLSQPRLLQLFSHMLLIHNFSATTLFGINASFWSIAIEMQLYVLYPLILAIAARKGWGRAIAATALVEIGLRGLMAFGWSTGVDLVPFWLTSSPLNYVMSWSLGTWVADAYVRQRPLPLHSHSVVGWGLLSVASMFFLPTAPFMFLLISVTTATGISKALHNSVTSITPFPKAIGLVGLASYSVYLLHQPILLIAISASHNLGLTANAHPLVDVALCLLVFFPILLFSWISYQYIEVPFARLGRGVQMTASRVRNAV